jgi:hypothetical protein
VTELLVNLAVGVIGAVLGAFVAYRLQAREGERLARGAARAVYIELTSNMTAARMASEGELLGELRQQIYIAESSRLATYLTASELLSVAWAYELVPAGMVALANLRAGAGHEADSTDRALLAVLAGEIEPTTALLNRRLWSDQERDALKRGVPGRHPKDHLAS